MASLIRLLMKAFCVAARPAMKPAVAIALSLLLPGSVRAEIIYSNLNTDPSSTNFTYGFTQFAQRITTVSEGTGLHLDVNIIALFGPENYVLELWSADGAGTDVGAFLAPIGSGVVSTTDPSSLTSFDLTYGLAASTNYFVTLTTTADVALVLGPSSSTALNSVFRYGVGGFPNVDNSFAAAMKVDVAAVVVPEIDPTGVCSVFALVTGGLGLLERRRRRT